MWLVAAKNRRGEWTVLTGNHSRFKRMSEIADILSESDKCQEVHFAQIKSSMVRSGVGWIDIDVSNW